MHVYDHVVEASALAQAEQGMSSSGRVLREKLNNTQWAG
jgi:hypothetical protein